MQYSPVFERQACGLRGRLYVRGPLFWPVLSVTYSNKDRIMLWRRLAPKVQALRPGVE